MLCVTEGIHFPKRGAKNSGTSCTRTECGTGVNIYRWWKLISAFVSPSDPIPTAVSVFKFV